MATSHAAGPQEAQSCWHGPGGAAEATAFAPCCCCSFAFSFFSSELGRTQRRKNAPRPIGSSGGWHVSTQERPSGARCFLFLQMAQMSAAEHSKQSGTSHGSYRLAAAAASLAGARAPAAKHGREKKKTKTNKKIHGQISRVPKTTNGDQAIQQNLPRPQSTQYKLKTSISHKC